MQFICIADFLLDQLRYLGSSYFFLVILGLFLMKIESGYRLQP